MALTFWEIFQTNGHICVRQGPLEQDGEDGDARREEPEAAHRSREHGDHSDVGF